MVRVRKLALAIAAVSALSSGMAHALGLGEITLRSALNQPLSADIEVFDARGLEAGDLKPLLASPEEFGKAGLERPAFLGDLRFTAKIGADGRGTIHVASTRPVREPYLNFLVEVLWPSGRLLREYTMLLDPPLYSPQVAAAAAPQLPIGAANGAPAPAGRAPAASPAASVPTPAVPSNAAPRSYRTHSNDTLWAIAEDAGGQARVHQTMLAIQDLNPGAFIDGNINRLKSGQVLRLPDNAQIQRRSRGEAIREVAAQNATWRQARRAPARQLDASPRDTPAQAEAPSERGDNLRLVAPDSDAASAGQDGDTGAAAENARLSEELAVTRESLDTTRRENEELKSRLSDLQSQLDKLQRLIELKDQRMAELEAGAGAASEAEQPAADAAQPAEAEQQAAEQAPVEEPAEPDAGGLLSLLSSPMMLALMGGSIVLLLLLALLVVSRRGKNQDAVRDESPKGDLDDDFADESLSAGLDSEDEGLVGVDPQPEDPLTEADLLVAYGRFSQAAELLERAIDAEPQRRDLRLKLLEVEGEQGNRQGFERQERELRDLGGAEAQIAELRARYAGLLGVAAGAAAYAATQQSAQDDDDLGLDDLSFSDLESSAPEPAAAAEPAPSSAADEPAFPDFDFEALQREFGGPEEAEPEAPAGTPVESDDLGLDFDLGNTEKPLQDHEPAFDEALFDAPEEPAAPASRDELEDAFAALDDAPAEESEPPATREDELPMDFDLGLDDDEPHVEEPAPAPAPAVEPPAAFAGLDDDEDDDFDFLGGTDEVATKLDLAQAYLDMGDNEGARDILGEVLAEGNEEQQQAARELMERLG